MIRHAAFFLFTLSVGWLYAASVPEQPFPPSETVALFLKVDEAEREFRPHAAAAFRRQLLARCGEAGEAPSLVFPCALAARESNERTFLKSLPLARWLLPEPPLPWELMSALPFSERTAWEGRAFLSGSLRGDRSPGKGFLALESVVRLFPDFEAGRWWRYEAALAQRQPTRIASALADLKIHGVSEAPASFASRSRLDGVTFGVAPMGGYQSFSGFFFGVRAWDERAFDEARSIAVTALAFTNETLLGAFQYSDRVLLSPVMLETEFTGGFDRRRFFTNLKSDPTYFRQTQAAARAGAAFEFTPLLTARAGYRIAARGDEAPNGGLAVAPLAGTLVHGPELSLTFDSRDSAVVPRDGHQIVLAIRRSFLEGQPSFWDTRLRAETYHSLSRFWSWSATAAGSFFEGDYRRDLLPVWGTDTFRLPGLAPERYRARRGAGASTELQHEVAEGVRAFAFGTALALGEPLLSTDGFVWGVGLGTEISFTRKTRPTFRFEMGLLSEELSFRSDWRVAL